LKKQILKAHSKLKKLAATEKPEKIEAKFGALMGLSLQM